MGFPGVWEKKFHILFGSIDADLYTLFCDGLNTLLHVAGMHLRLYTVIPKKDKYNLFCVPGTIHCGIQFNMVAQK